jgi:hypothetical protein
MQLRQLWSLVRVLKDDTDTLPLNFSSQVAEACNTSFSVGELLVALECCCNTFPGPNILCCLTFHLSTCRKGVSTVHEQSYVDRNLVPATWREAAVNPILKPSKNQSLATSYRLTGSAGFMYKLNKQQLRTSPFERPPNTEISFFMYYTVFEELHKIQRLYSC